jgi:hypothetical protein
VTAPEMRMRSGQEDSTDPVVALLYVIMRDHLPAADIEQAVETVIGGTLYEFTNGWLAKYAIDVRERLAGKHPTKAQQRRREENTL